MELSDAVWSEAFFRAANPGYRLGKPFVRNTQRRYFTTGRVG